MVWLIMRSFSGRHAALQLFKPVQHDVDLRRRRTLLVPLDHQKSLVVWADVVVRRKWAVCLVMPFEQHPGLACRETRLRGNICGHHPVAVAIEELPAAPRPNWFRAAIGRDLPLATRAGKRPDVYLFPA